MPEALEIRLRQLLVAVRRDDSRVQADAGDALQGPVPAGRGLLQRPPRGRDRRDRAEQLPLVAHHPEIADHPGPVRDRARTSPACDTTPVPPPVTSRPRDHPVAFT